MKFTIVIKHRQNAQGIEHSTDDRIGPFINRAEAERCLTAAVSQGATDAYILPEPNDR